MKKSDAIAQLTSAMTLAMASVATASGSMGATGATRWQRVQRLQAEIDRVKAMPGDEVPDAEVLAHVTRGRRIGPKRLLAALRGDAPTRVRAVR